MKQVKFPLMAAVMTVAVAMSSPTLAQNKPKCMGHNMPEFAEFDSNDDGSITETEFLRARSERLAKRAEEGRKMKNLANAPAFQDIDTDDDGVVSQEEFAAHQAEHKAEMQ